MRILLTTPIWPPEIGGPATYVKELAGRLRGQHQISILAFADNPELIDGANLRTVSKRLPLPIRQIIFLIRLLRLGRKTDIIYAQNAMAAGLPSIIAGKFLRKPVVIKFVGDGAWERAFGRHLTRKFLDDFLTAPDTGWQSKLRIKLQRYVFNNANRIVVPSEYLKSVLTNHYQIPGPKIETVYNAVETTPVSSLPANNATNNSKYQIISVARLVPWKGLGGIIKAVKILSDESPVNLVIAGHGPDKDKLIKMAANLGIADKVNLLGSVSPARVAELCQQSSVFVLNSIYEGLPHVVLSAFAASVPVVATNIPGTNEVVSHNQTGLTVPPGEPEALATAIKTIINDRGMSRRLTGNARSFLQEKFSWPTHLTKLTDLFSTILAPTRNKSR